MVRTGSYNIELGAPKNFSLFNDQTAVAVDRIFFLLVPINEVHATRDLSSYQARRPLSSIKARDSLNLFLDLELCRHMAKAHSMIVQLWSSSKNPKWAVDTELASGPKSIPFNCIALTRFQQPLFWQLVPVLVTKRKEDLVHIIWKCYYYSHMKRIPYYEEYILLRCNDVCSVMQK